MLRLVPVPMGRKNILWASQVLPMAITKCATRLILQGRKPKVLMQRIHWLALVMHLIRMDIRRRVIVAVFPGSWQKGRRSVPRSCKQVAIPSSIADFAPMMRVTMRMLAYIRFTHVTRLRRTGEVCSRFQNLRTSLIAIRRVD
ncbi:hypothetical protein D3C81_1469340 [compost metagenome]